MILLKHERDHWRFMSKYFQGGRRLKFLIIYSFYEIDSKKKKKKTTNEKNSFIGQLSGTFTRVELNNRLHIHLYCFTTQRLNLFFVRRLN